MTAPFKILIFSKRRPDIDAAAFRSYYESRHAPLCARYSAGVSRYIRRYLEPQDHPETGPADELMFDAITELWFEDEALFRGALGYLTTSVMPDEITADERNLFDRASFRIATVVECETNLPRVPAA